jgi:hypothetical protein
MRLLNNIFYTSRNFLKQNIVLNIRYNIKVVTGTPLLGMLMQS